MSLQERGLDKELDEFCDNKFKHSFFKEKEECLNLVQAVIDEVDPSDIPERFVKIISEYQEMSNLLDGSLEDIIVPLMEKIKEIVHESMASRIKKGFNEPTLYMDKKLDALFSCVYFMCSVRGAKTVVKFMPHEVSDLEPALHMLLSHDPEGHETWHNRYVLLIWLSMLVLMPFDLKSLDSTVAVGEDKESALITTLISTCKSYLGDAGLIKDAAAKCLGSLLTRPDLEKHYLSSFVDWATGELQNLISGGLMGNKAINTLYGIYKTLHFAFKSGHRENLLDMAVSIFPSIFDLTPEDPADRKKMHPTHRLLATKLIQRMGLMCMPPKIASWRYSRGQRSLLENVESGAVKADEELNKTHEEEEELEEDIPEEVEGVLNALMQSLSDSFLNVRWSASKGIGRICDRLPRSYVDDFVGFLIEPLRHHWDDEAEEEEVISDSTWHGVCLCFGELARRGLLLPERLGDVVPAVLVALNFDQPRGSTSVGAHVRDAACYVCWAFARAYSPEVMHPHVGDLALAMLKVALFDREVNCRRAASAAFQENVGRQGAENFPHGIEILTHADFFTLGNRIASFTTIAHFVAQFNGYAIPFINHVMDKPCAHWDDNMRRLSALTLEHLTPLEPDYIANTVLPALLDKVLSPNPNERHGASLCVGSIVMALAKVKFLVGEDTAKRLRNIVVKIENKRLYTGRNGFRMRGSVCDIICALASSMEDMSQKLALRLLQTVAECLKQPHEDIQHSACAALNALAHRQIEFSPANVAKINERFIGQLATNNPAARRGAALALGSLPRRFLVSNLNEILKALMKACRVERSVYDRDELTRRYSALSLIKVVLVVGTQKKGSEDGLTDEMLSDVFKTMFICLRDYTLSDRGDVGTIVRTAGMTGLEALIIGLLRDVNRNHYSYADKSSEWCTPGKILWTPYGPASVQLPLVNAHGEDVVLVSFTDGDFETYPDIKSLASIKNTYKNFYHHGTAWLPVHITHPVEETEEPFIMEDLESRMSCLRSFEEQAADLDCEAAPVPSGVIAVMDLPMTSAIIGRLLKQLSEKIDGMRNVAGEVLFRLLHRTTPVLPYFENRSELISIFPKDLCSRPYPFIWRAAHNTFPLITPILKIPFFRPWVLSGLVLSVGGQTESVMKASRNALSGGVKGKLSWLDKQLEGGNKRLVADIMTELLDILEKNIRKDRVAIPVLKTIAFFQLRGITEFMDPEVSDLLPRVIRLTKKTIENSKNTQKLCQAADVLLGCAHFPSLHDTIIPIVLELIGSQYPVVQRESARAFLEQAAILMDLLPEEEDKWLDIQVNLTELVNAPTEDERIVQFIALHELLGVEVNISAPSKKLPDSVAPEEKDSYQHLVEETGY
eukprot:TRINITY_DN2641_c0_g1_i1.p1 TRINITY_DN2641_c0_g1~~TRINITY_DN2641_c0_g1_i1.p1  ORF type:complete len:1359 (+),score=487.32 TRINITY_DN2641_c0_g1_i1:110-4186(+)